MISIGLKITVSTSFGIIWFLDGLWLQMEDYSKYVIMEQKRIPTIFFGERVKNSIILSHRKANDGTKEAFSVVPYILRARHSYTPTIIQSMFCTMGTLSLKLFPIVTILINI